MLPWIKSLIKKSKESNRDFLFLFSMYCGLCRVNPHIPLFNLSFVWLPVIGANPTQSDFVAILFFDVSERSDFISAFIIRRTVLLFFTAYPQIRELNYFSW